MTSSRWIRLSTAAAVMIASGARSIGTARAADKDCIAAASLGQEVRDQGRLLEARAQFQACAQSECPAPIPTYCAEWLSDVARKLPTFVVRVVDDEERDLTDATLAVDGRPVDLDGRSIEIDPGRHRIRIASPGKRPYETEIVAAQSEKDRVILGRLLRDAPLSRPAPAPAPRRRPEAPSWIAWGIGAAGLLSFTFFGIRARVDYDDYKSWCGQRCAFSARESVANTIMAADISLVVGLVGAAAGTALYLLQPSSPPAGRPAAALSGLR